MSTPRSDELLFAAGGDVWEKYGTFVKRTLPEEERGTFSRSSDATYTDRSGNLRTAESGVLRPHYVSSESSYSARLEAARTNSILDSEALTSGNWSTSTASTTVDDAVAPDGTVSMERIFNDSGGDTGVRITQGVTISAGAQVAASLFVKPDTTDYCALTVEDVDDGFIRISTWFEITGDGAVHDESASQIDRAGIEKVGDHYWIWAVVTPDVNTTSVNFGIGPTYSDGTVSGNWPESADGDAIHAWGCQLEEGAAFPSSYVATAGSSGTRNADEFSAPFLHAPRGMTVYGKLQVRQPDTSLRYLQIGNNDGGDDAWLQVRQNGSASVRFDHDNGSSVVNTSFSGDTIGWSSIVEVRCVLTSDGAVKGGYLVDGASESTSGASSTNSLADVWADRVLQFNASGTDAGQNNTGFNDHLLWVIAAGERSMTEMQSVEL